MNALTAVGHTDLKLARPWQLLGAMESLNGWILFGLSTAYLFALIQSIWTHTRPGHSIAEQISELLTIELLSQVTVGDSEFFRQPVAVSEVASITVSDVL